MGILRRAPDVGQVLRRPPQESLSIARRRAQPVTVTIVRLTVTAVVAFEMARVITGANVPILAPLTALLVVQVTLFHTFRTALQRVASVVLGVVVALGLSAWLGFTWWSLGLTIAAALIIGYALRLGDSVLEVPISAMLIFSVGSQAAASTRIIETLVGAAAGLAAGLVFAPVRVQPAKEAVGELSRQMADLLGQMAEGLAEAPDPRRAAEWLDRTRALRGEIERVDDALSQAEESVRLNPRRLRSGDPAAGLRDGVDTLERAATDVRVLARSVADSARLDSEHSPVREAETRARLAAVIAELSAAVRAYGQLLEAEPVAPEHAAFAAEPITEALEDHLEEAQRQQDQLADLLSTNPAGRPEGWQLRGEILAHVDRLRSELEPSQLPEPPKAKPPLLAPPLKALHVRRDRRQSERHHSEWHPDPAAADAPATASSAAPTTDASATGPRRRPNRNAMRVRARRTASRVRARHR